MKQAVFAGQRYGHLVVESFAGHSVAKKRMWTCRCDCGEVAHVASPHLRSGHTVSCGCRRQISGMQRRSKIEDRFWARVRKADGCWSWTGFINQDGYGLLSRPGRHSSKIGAHRLSWEIHNGPVPNGMNVCHHCDNPQCANPEHLFLGTQQDNMQDCARKRRIFLRPQDGEMNATAKLTNAQAREIREAYSSTGVLQTELAAQYGVESSAISSIVRGATYRAASGPITRRYKNHSLNARRWG